MTAPSTRWVASSLTEGGRRSELVQRHPPSVPRDEDGREQAVPLRRRESELGHLAGTISSSAEAV